MSKAKSEWDAETARLEQIRRSYWKNIRLIDEARQEGVTSVPRIDDDGNEFYHLIDRDKRILSGECSDYFQLWYEYVAVKGAK